MRRRGEVRRGLARARRQDHGLRPPRLPRGGSRARAPQRTADELGSPRRVGEELERPRSRLLERHPERCSRRTSSTTGDRPRRRRTIPPCPPRCSPARASAGWSAHILEQKRTRAFRPSARYVGPALRARSPRRMTLAEAAARRTPSRRRATRGLRAPSSGTRDRGGARERRLSRPRARVRAIAQFRFRPKLELLRRGLEDESPGRAWLRADRARGLSRTHPGDVNAFRPLLHELALAIRTPPSGASRSCA
jgi:hypothetical protein